MPLRIIPHSASNFEFWLRHGFKKQFFGKLLDLASLALLYKKLLDLVGWKIRINHSAPALRKIVRHFDSIHGKLTCKVSLIFGKTEGMNSKPKIEVVEPAPVLNIPEFHLAFGGASGCEIPRDLFGHPKHMEFVALPGQIFTVEEIHPRHHHNIYRISSSNYRNSNLFLDSRFAKPALGACVSADVLVRSDLAQKMKRLLGTKYVWGGNWSSGINKMLQFYPPQKALDEETLALWTLKGVDCSGLLYETTQGASPRNTQGLIHFGKALPIEGKTTAEIAALLLPMDMAVWAGHVWFVLDQHHSIESKSPFGVIQRPLFERLEETCKERSGVNAWPEKFNPESYFTIRRFCSH